MDVYSFLPTVQNNKQLAMQTIAMYVIDELLMWIYIYVCVYS